MTGGILGIAALVQDLHMLRAVADSIAAGRLDEAAARARRVVILRSVMRDRLLAQLPVVGGGSRRFPRELPLLEAVLALGPDPALEARCRTLRVLPLGRPDTLTLARGEVRVGKAVPASPAPPAPASRPVRFAAVPLGPSTPTGEQPHRLTRVGPDGRRVVLGTGWAGLLGRSWDLSLDGETAAVARADERLIERWSLETARVTLVSLAQPPRFVALPPRGRDERLAWGAARTPEGAHAQVLHVQVGERSRRLFPPAGLAPAALGCEWDPDGQTLLVRWLEAWPHRAGDRQHLVWLTPEGRELMRAVGPLGPHTQPPRWVRGPGPWVGLTASEAAWVWDGRAARARLLPTIRGAWGWSPDGRLLAGLDVGHVFVALADDVRSRKDFRLEGLPPLFVPDREDGLVWDADGLRLKGRSAERAAGPWRETTVAVTFAVGEAPSP